MDSQTPQRQIDPTVEPGDRVGDPKGWPHDPGPQPPERWPWWAWHHGERTEHEHRNRAPWPTAMWSALLALAVLSGVVGATWIDRYRHHDGTASVPPTTTRAARPTSAQDQARPAGDFPISAALPSVVLVISAGAAHSGFVTGPGQVVTTATGLSDGPMSVVLADGSSAPASLVGTDPPTGTALLAVDPDLLAGFPALVVRATPLADGEKVFCLGPPQGVGEAITAGTASERTLAGGPTAVLATRSDDTRTGSVFAGSPVVDTQGQLVGLALEGTAGGMLIGDITPAVRRLSVIPWAGQQPSATLPLTLDPTSPATIASVTDSAARAGIAPGDVVVSVNGVAVSSSAMVVAAAARALPGDDIELRYIHNGATLTVVVAAGP